MDVLGAGGCVIAMRRLGLKVSRRISARRERHATTDRLGPACACGSKAPTTGNKVSRANNRTKRRWYPNLQTVRVLVDGQPKRVRVCTQCIKSNRITKAS